MITKTHMGTRVVTMTSESVPKKKKQVTHNDTNIVASSNTRAKRGPLQEESNWPQHRQRGRSTTSVDGGYVHHSHKSSSSSHKNREVTTEGKENNEGCVSNVDDEHPPPHQLEIVHMLTPIPKRKRNTSEGNTKDPGELGVNMKYMEVDDVDEVPTWVAIHMVESKFFVEDLSHNGPTNF